MINDAEFREVQKQASTGLYFILTLLCAYEVLLRGLPSVVSHSLHEAYHLSGGTFGGLCFLFFLVYAPVQLGMGIWVDRLDLRRIAPWFLLCCALGCYLFASASDFWFAALARIFMGLGVSFIVVTVLTWVARTAPPQWFTLYLGMVISGSMLGGCVLHSTLTMFEHTYGWRLLCYVVSCVGLVLMVLARIGLCMPVVRFADRPKRSLYCLMRQPRLILNSLLGALLVLPTLLFSESWGADFIRHVDLFHDASASMLLTYNFIGLALGAPCFGWCFDRTSQHQFILSVSTVMITIVLSIILYVPDISSAMMALFLGLLGFFTSSFVIIYSLSRRGVEAHEQAMVFGIANFYMVAGSIFIWLVGGVMDWLEKAFLREFLGSYYTISNYQLALLLLPLCSVLALFMTFYVRSAE